MVDVIDMRESTGDPIGVVQLRIRSDDKGVPANAVAQGIVDEWRAFLERLTNRRGYSKKRKVKTRRKRHLMPNSSFECCEKNTTS